MGCQEERVASLEEAVDRKAQVEEVLDVALVEEEPVAQTAPTPTMRGRGSGTEAHGSMT